MDINKWFNLYRSEVDRPDGKVKDKNYYLDMTKHVFSQLANGTGTFAFALTANGASRRSSDELRTYARALQPTTKYLKQLGYSEKEITKFTESNISHQPYAIFPKTRNIIQSKFTDLNIMPDPEALDSTALYDKLFTKNRLKFILNPKTRQNVPEAMIPREASFLQSEEDVDYLFQIGGVQLPIEIALGKCLRMSTDNSDFEIVNKLMIEDLVDLGGMACDRYIENGNVKIRYVDFARVVAKPSIYPDYRDSDMRGYVMNRKISDIMMEDPDAVQENWDQLEKLYKGQHFGFDHTIMRDTKEGFREDFTNRLTSLRGISDFGATVLKLYWLDVDFKRFVVGRHGRGHRIFEEVDSEFELSDRAKRARKKIETFSIQNIYTANWIVGTNIIFSSGLADTIVRQGHHGAKKIIWPMPIFAAQEPSLVEKVIPLIDDIQIAMMKRRSIISKIPPGLRMVVYKNRIKDTVTMNGEQYSLPRLISLYQREGLMILEERDDYSMPNEDLARNKPPIEFITSGAGEELRQLEESIVVSTDRIRQVTGINPVVDGTATKADILKSVAESMETSANNALRPWMELYINFRKNLYDMMTWTYITLTASNPDLFKHSPLWPVLAPLREIGPDLLKYDIGLNVKVVDSSRIQLLMQELFARKDLLPIEGYLAVMNALSDKEIDMAEFMLMKFTKIARERDQAHQERLVALQAQEQGKAAQATEQVRLQAHQMKIGGDMQKDQQEAALNEQKAKQDHVRDIEKILITEEAKAKGNTQVVRENKQNSVFKQTT